MAGDECCSQGGAGPELDRREFMAAAGGMAMGAMASGLPLVAGPFEPLGAREDGDHFVPAEKKLTGEWTRALFARGERTWYSGEELKTIGMPVGGICAGQLYLTGDGRLAHWGIFNQAHNTGYGRVNYEVGKGPEATVRGGKIVPAASVDQGFALQVRAGGKRFVRSLDRRGFPGVRFSGEYPIGRVEYRDESIPVEVRLEAFSPFIPLNAADSALPATVMQYVVRNTSETRVEVLLAGWLQNAVCLYSGPQFGERVIRSNRRVQGDGLTSLLCEMHKVEVPEEKAERPPHCFADFEGDDYGDWKVEGHSFGKSPASGTLKGQQSVSGFQGKGLVNTFLGGDGPRGKLTSPPFEIERPYIGFLIGGGSHEGKTCVNLLVEGKVVRAATGVNNERLQPHNWDVRDLSGEMARIEIVDDASGGWGHINCDQIEFRDSPMTPDPGELHLQPDYGSLSLSVLGDGSCHTSLPSGPLPDGLFEESAETSEKPVDDLLRGAVGRSITLEPGEEKEVTFVVAWEQPNLYSGATLVGNRGASRFGDAAAVAIYVARNFERLAGETRLWHETYYDSTLPRWLLDRLHSTVSILASGTCQWWGNGRFWGWEGVGCCRGTCGHVWNYAHALARLFPELERSVREQQDFAPEAGFDPETGAIRFRGEGWDHWAGDSQGGYILKAYREHLLSTNDGFLRRNWQRIRKAMEFLIEQDADGDGLIEGKQHQTYDQNYYGANTMVGSLYLGALGAAWAMAREIVDGAFEKTCREIFQVGGKNSVKRLFNGEYFIQEVDLGKHPDWQYANGCLADQLFGVGWARQVGLGYLYPREKVLSALKSIWKYCWAPDVGPQNGTHKPERYFALPGEAGLFTCTWPKGKHLGSRSTRYRNEVWTGIEYQVAGHMAWEGMVTEALAICRGIHERYHPAKHNPWNEVECGDHYARALASWGVLIGLAGFDYHGPMGRIRFAPRITPKAFRSVFTAAEGWGSLAQEREGNTQTNRIEVKWGRLRVGKVLLALPEGASLKRATITMDGKEFDAQARGLGQMVLVDMAPDTLIHKGSTLQVTSKW